MYIRIYYIYMVEQKWCIVEYGHFVQKIPFENMGFGCVNVQTKPHHQVINRTAVRFILYIYIQYIYISHMRVRPKQLVAQNPLIIRFPFSHCGVIIPCYTLLATLINAIF